MILLSNCVAWEDKEMRRVTTKAICAAIKDKTGYDVNLNRGEGYFYFDSDDKDTALLLCRAHSTSIYVNTLSSLSVDAWLRDFENILLEMTNQRRNDE